MQQSGRRTRPPLERKEPQRSFLEWTKGFSEDAGERRPPNEGDADQRSAADSGDPVFRTVNDAYRLIDEYVRRGRRAAEDMWIPSHDAGHFDQRLNVPVRFMRAMGDMTMAWIEMMQELTTVPPPDDGAVGPFTAGHAAPTTNDVVSAGTRQALRISVSATSPVEVTVHLLEPAAVSALVATELRSFSANAPAAARAMVDRAAPGEAPLLRIDVPPGQSSGTYSGLLLDAETQEPRGTITLIVGQSVPRP